MTLWGMERLRLFRTGRWVPVVATFVLFGVTGPLTVRYQQALFRRFGSGNLRIVAPPPVPADGLAAFLGNAQQLGLLAVVVVAAGALAFDARPAVSAFLRTRVHGTIRLLVPKFVLNALVAMGGFVLGGAVAWALTASLIGRLPTGPVLEGIGLWLLYLAFAVAVVALAAAVARSQLATVLASLGGLVALGAASLVRGAGPWLPSYLVGSPNALVGGTPAGDFLRAAVVTAVAVPLLLWGAARLADRREL